ncbi:hypothetical protein JL721_4285 [Aureococcus anophagefferens]|nr:hypothetical protein JL721_4285 [Aureococcus anophagefferens]
MSALASSRGREGGLRELVRSIVQRDILRSCAGKCRGWMVLVLDEQASRVLTPVLGMYDLMEERVTLVESLEKRRQPFPEMDCIYVSAATDRSVRAICADWKGRADAPYAEAHVFFLSRLDDQQLAMVGATSELAARLKTLSELSLDFLALESQAFDLGAPGSFALGGAPGVPEAAAAKKLATVLATLGEGRPCVRYRSGNARSRAFGDAVLGELRALDLDDSTKDAATVLVLDRLDDALTPLVHEYSKQTKGGEARDFAMLNEKDALWVEMRHEHVARVVNQLRARTSDFLDHNRGAAQLHQGKGSELTLGDMANALQAMPEFQAATAALNKHMSVAHEALGKFHGAGLLELSNLEQSLATGRDEADQTHVAAAGRPTADDAAALGASAKAREKSERRKKTSNLARLRGAMKLTFAAKKGDEPDDDVADSRYAPPAKALLAALADGSLDGDLYPALGGGGAGKPAKAAPVSVRKNASRLAGAKKKEAFGGSRLVVVVLGGVTYSELRSAYEVSREKRKEVIIGGTQLLTPDTFLAQLADSKK